MERQITQTKWNLRQMLDQRINQLERIQLTQQSHPESRGMQNPTFSYQKIQNRKMMLVLQKIWNQGQTNVIDSRENNIMKQKEEFKFYLKSIAYRMKDSIKKIFTLLRAPKITLALRQFERQQVGFDFQAVTRGQNKRFIRSQDPEKPDEYDIEYF